MRQTVRSGLQAGLVLMVLAGVSAGLLEGLKQLGAPHVSKNRARFQAERLMEVLAGVRFDNSPSEDVVTLFPEMASHGLRRVFRARLQGRPVAYVLELETPRAYSGSIRMLVSVAADGSVIRATVLAHKETPGIGDRIEPSRSKWLNRLSGHQAASAVGWREAQQAGPLDALTGATVTSRAAGAGIYRALEFFAAHRADLERLGPGKIMRH